MFTFSCTPIRGRRQASQHWVWYLIDRVFDGVLLRALAAGLAFLVLKQLEVIK